MKISTTKKVNGEAVEVEVNVSIPKTVGEALEKFADATQKLYMAAVTEKVRVIVRNLIDKGLDQAAIQEKLKGWNLDTHMPRTPADPVAAFKKKLAGMSPEEQAAAIANIQS